METNRQTDRRTPNCHANIFPSAKNNTRYFLYNSFVSLHSDLLACAHFALIILYAFLLLNVIVNDMLLL